MGVGLGLGAGVRWAGLRMGLGGKLLGYSLLSLTLKKRNRDKKEKKGRLGEEVGHASNFPRLTKMSSYQEK